MLECVAIEGVRRASCAPPRLLLLGDSHQHLQGEVGGRLRWPWPWLWLQWSWLCGCVVVWLCVGVVEWWSGCVVAGGRVGWRSGVRLTIITIIMHMESARIDNNVSCARERSVKTT